VIEAGGKCLLVGVGEGPMTVLAELDAEKVRSESAAVPSTKFADVLARVLRREPPQGQQP
jgi:flagellar biogenesis protein FliO